MKKTTKTTLVRVSLFTVLGASLFILSSSLFAYRHGNGGHRPGGGGGYRPGGGGGGYGRSCVVELQTWRGRTLDTFRARNCRRAVRQCERELRYRHRMNRNPYARCVVTRRPGNGGGSGDDDWGRGWTCTARANGWEQHWGGHSASARRKWRARERAMRRCERVHGSCYVSCQRD